MVNLNLAPDEAIILDTEGVVRIAQERMRLQHLVLTNKCMYFLYTKSNGLFARPEDIIIRRPLSDIKIIQGRPMAEQVKSSNYGTCLQIQFVQGIEQFAFESSPKKTIANWINELYRILVGQECPTSPKSDFISGLSNGLGSLAANLREVADNAIQSATVSYGNVREQAQSARQREADALSRVQQLYTPQSNDLFCAKCGKKLPPSANFCSGCGSSTESITRSRNASYEAADGTTRQQQFAGTILKCPSCGSVVSQTTAICPDCGHRFTGQAAVKSIQSFTDQLMAIEVTRKTSRFGMLNPYAPPDPADKMKLSLIRNYPIPNTIDDITEFIILAIANIDVSVSKKTWGNTSSSMETLAIEMPRTISNAWVAKMKQAYQKAKIMFPDDPAFTYVKKLYYDEMKALKMKVED